LSFSFCWY